MTKTTIPWVYFLYIKGRLSSKFHEKEAWRWGIPFMSPMAEMLGSQTMLTACIALILTPRRCKGWSECIAMC